MEAKKGVISPSTTTLEKKVLIMPPGRMRAVLAVQRLRCEWLRLGCTHRRAFRHVINTTAQNLMDSILPEGAVLIPAAMASGLATCRSVSDVKAVE